MIRLEEIEAARRRQQDRVLTTPLFGAPDLVPGFSEGLWLKAENLQHTGSFKIRGATNKIAQLSAAERRRGVVAASAGNHAQGVARAASVAGVPAVIVMPIDAPVVKTERSRGYGAEVELVDGGLEGAVARAHELRDERGLTFIHPFDDPLIQAGQGTCGLEILEQLADVDSIVVPVGGGGLLAGIAVAVKALRPGVRLFGVQAEGADPAARSLRSGRLERLEHATTMADGIRVRSIADSTLEIFQEHVEDVVTASDEAISRAMVLLMERSRLVVEGAGAAGVAAAAAGRLPRDCGRTVVVLSGGNADTNLLARVIERGLTSAGRWVLVRVRIRDTPGQLRRILEVVAAERANILDIHHDRSGWRVPLGDVEAQLLLETRRPGHGIDIVAALRAQDLDARLEEPAG